MALWKPSLLMFLYIMYTLLGVRVKDKACIYNDLRTRTRIGCIAGIGLHRRWPGRAKTDCRVSKSDMGMFRQIAQRAFSLLAQSAFGVSVFTERNKISINAALPPRCHIEANHHDRRRQPSR